MKSLSHVRLTINLPRLEYNLLHAAKLCQEKQISLAAVTKSICADEKILEMIEKSPVSVIADSRLDNFAKMHTKKKRFLIRPAIPQEAEAVVAYTDISMEVSRIAIEALGAAAEKARTPHEILLMVDLGDFRDGIYYKNRQELHDLAAWIHAHKWLRLAGIAANYNCFLGLQPDAENMQSMADLFHFLSPFYDVEEPVVSCGNSSSMKLLTENSFPIPPEITQFRMGEAVMLGRDPSDNTLIPGFAYDAFTLAVPLIEVFEKPVDAFPMRRGVLCIGKQDLHLDYLYPLDERVRLLGGCSDECVADLSAAPEYKAGDVLKFGLEYNALMTLFAGGFFCKEYIE